MVLPTNCQLTDLLLSEIVSVVFFSTRLLSLGYIITYEKAAGYFLIPEPLVVYVTFGIYIFIDFLLLIGCIKKIKWLLILWQCAAMVWVALSILEIFFHETFRDFILGLFSIIMTGWAALTIYRALQELHEESVDNALQEIDENEDNMDNNRDLV